MQDYFQDLSGKNLYSVYVAARRKTFSPESPDTVEERLAEAAASDTSVVDLLPDLYRLAALSADFEEFRSRYETVITSALEIESGRGADAGPDTGYAGFGGRHDGPRE